MHALPGMELTGADPDRPSAEVIGAYFDTYERTFGLRVHRPVDVRAVRDGLDGRLLVESSEGTYAARALISATGTWDRPFWPRFPGRTDSPPNAVPSTPEPRQTVSIRLLSTLASRAGIRYTGVSWSLPVQVRRRPAADNTGHPGGAPAR